MANTDFIQGSIEICGAIVCFLSVFILYFITDFKKNSAKIITTTVGIQTFSLLNDAGWYIYDADTSPFGVFINWFCSFSIYICDPVEIICATLYMYSLLNEDNKTVSKIFLKLVYALAGLAIVLPFINYFVPILYAFNEHNIYYRLDGWYFYTGICLTALMVDLCFLVYYRKLIGKGTFIAGIIFVLAPIIGTILQSLFLGISWINIGITISLWLMMFIYLKRWAVENNSSNRLIPIILFVIVVLFVSASIISSIFILNKIATDKSREESRIIAYAVNESINNVLAKPIAVAETMSYSNRLKTDISSDENLPAIENDLIAYLNSIKKGMDFQQIFVVSDKTKLYYTYKGINKKIDVENDSHDIWYKKFKDSGKRYDLDVDVDETNQKLSIFVNTELRDDNGNFLGVCGIAVYMDDLQKILAEMENEYSIDIKIIDENGLVQVGTNTEHIEHMSLDNNILNNIGNNDFYYERHKHSATIVRYMDNLGLYMIIEDHNPNKINILKIIMPSVFIFLLGLIIMLIIFRVLDLHENSLAKELMHKKKLSETDTLTGLYNRNAYEIDTAYWSDNKELNKLAVIMIDVNGLKTVNDNIGHEAGDELIKGAALCINRSFGGRGRVYRTGGDEFIVVLDNVDYDLNNIVNSFLDEVKNWSGNLAKELSVSLGISTSWDNPNFNFNDLVKLADKLMYENKNEYYKRTGKTRRTNK